LILFVLIPMGNAPVVHEVATSFQSLGDAIAGDLDGASRRWDDYAKESVIGSGCAALHHHIQGDNDKALEYGKSMGRATGKLIAGGGMLSDIPVFQELKYCGDSLGDVFSGDAHLAEQRWTEDYVEDSCIGSGIGAAIADGQGDTERGDELRHNCGKAWVRAGVQIVQIVQFAPQTDSAMPPPSYQ